MAADSPETWVQAISKAIVQAAKVGAPRVVSVNKVRSALLAVVPFGPVIG